MYDQNLKYKYNLKEMNIQLNIKLNRIYRKYHIM